MYEFKKVLVTGGAGCIGLGVCKELVKRGVSVVLFDLYEQINQVEKYIPKEVELYYGSILDSSSLGDALEGCNAIIHLAAYLGVRRTEINRLRCLEININGTRNVLECGIQNRIKKIVFASSSEVYGEPEKNPINEKCVTQGKTVYAITKLAGEEFCKAYTQRFPELSYVILRFFNTYGPYQIAQFVIPKFIRSIQQGEPPIIYGDGSQKRSYCYVSDTAWATVEALISKKADGEIINIGNSKCPVSLSSLADLLITKCGRDDKIRPRYERQFNNADRGKEREIFNRYCDTSRAEKILNFFPRVSLEQGIENVIKEGILFPKWASTDFYYTIDESL